MSARMSDWVSLKEPEEPKVDRNNEEGDDLPGTSKSLVPLTYKSMNTKQRGLEKWAVWFPTVPPVLGVVTVG
jgi:hypothetical protein